MTKIIDKDGDSLDVAHHGDIIDLENAGLIVYIGLAKGYRIAPGSSIAAVVLFLHYGE
jgi:hypothetical protein